MKNTKKGGAAENELKTRRSFRRKYGHCW